MNPRHDITADHAIGLLNRHLSGDRWTFRRLDSRTCVWAGPDSTSVAVHEYADRPHRISIANRRGRIAFPLTWAGVADLHCVAEMAFPKSPAADNLRDALTAMAIVCAQMQHRRRERHANGGIQ